MATQVRFSQLTSAQHQAKVADGTVDSGTIYFLSDTQEIYRGQVRFGIGSGQIETYQERVAVSGSQISLQRFRTMYTTTVSANTDFDLVVPDGWTNYTVTFELEMNVTVDGLTISYPWVWMDDTLAPDLSKAGCYTLAIRGNHRNGAWVWRANLQDTEEAY